jgi:hypothetical protein
MYGALFEAKLVGSSAKKKSDPSKIMGNKKSRTASYTPETRRNDDEFTRPGYSCFSSSPMETPGASRPGKRRAQHSPIRNYDPPTLVRKRNRDDQQQRNPRRRRTQLTQIEDNMPGLVRKRDRDDRDAPRRNVVLRTNQGGA